MGISGERTGERTGERIGERIGERMGERKPRPPNLHWAVVVVRGERSPSEPEPSSSSLIDGSFFTSPPLLSQSAWVRGEKGSKVSFGIAVL